jgi:hypothetical protein
MLELHEEKSECRIKTPSFGSACAEKVVEFEKSRVMELCQPNTAPSITPLLPINTYGPARRKRNDGLYFWLLSIVRGDITLINLNIKKGESDQPSALSLFAYGVIACAA